MTVCVFECTYKFLATTEEQLCRPGEQPLFGPIDPKSQQTLQPAGQKQHKRWRSEQGYPHIHHGSQQHRNVLWRQQGKKPFLAQTLQHEQPYPYVQQAHAVTALFDAVFISTLRQRHCQPQAQAYCPSRALELRASSPFSEICEPCPENQKLKKREFTRC